ncbi:uncharacterized protein LOC105835215 [Monomorium pharaonis]|uniref:uncharacterized protein LOC105835215 n=1 Tax=Monomorium pharaonis TaxID=307658 RepID=UPI001746BC0F|nr:uncharacterized protein LOC105835215 [Monomorium pharaonis]
MEEESKKINKIPLEFSILFINGVQEDFDENFSFLERHILFRIRAKLISTEFVECDENVIKVNFNNILNIFLAYMHALIHTRLHYICKNLCFTQENLISMTDKNECNIILVLDNPKSSSTKDVVYEAITKVKDNIFGKLDKWVSALSNIIYTLKRPICGVRKQTLIISMCAPWLTISQNLKDAKKSMLIITHLIKKQYKLNNSLNNKEEDYCDLHSLHNCPCCEEKICCDNINTNSDDESPSHSNSKEEKCGDKNDKEEMDEEERHILSVEKRIEIMRDIIKQTMPEIEIVRTKDAYGRILAEDMYSVADVPSFRTSAKHGYAVLASDGIGIREVRAASPTADEISIVSGTCMLVRSGTAIPNGATAVVTPQYVNVTKQCKDNDNNDRVREIDVLIEPEKNKNIRHVGCEIEHGQQILKAHCHLGPAELGILILCGMVEVPVFKVPSVGLLSIGDMLEEPGNVLTSGRIYDGNRITLTSLLKENDYDPVDFGISADQLNAIIDKIKNALEKVDVLVTMGRANDKDMLKNILKQNFNATIHFDYVDMKPGKSTTFATCEIDDKRKYFLCMSANPVTVPTVAHIFLLPLLNELRCYTAEPVRASARVRLVFSYFKRMKRDAIIDISCRNYRCTRHPSTIKVCFPRIEKTKKFDEMALKCSVLFVGDEEEFIRNFPFLEYTIDNLNATLISTDVVECDENVLRRLLISLTDKNECNIIIVFGDPEFSSTKDVVYEAITKVIDDNIFKELNIAVSILNNLLNNLKRSICGVRKQTLIISMCDSWQTVLQSLEDVKQIFTSIIFLINSSKGEIYCDNNIKLDNAGPSHSISKEEMYMANNNEKEETNREEKINTFVIREMEIMRNIIESTPPQTEVMYTKLAHGRILAEDIHSTANVPAFRSSTKHGYAVLASDGMGTREVRAAPPTAIDNQISVAPGTCMWVRSRQPIPDGEKDHNLFVNCIFLLTNFNYCFHVRFVCRSHGSCKANNLFYPQRHIGCEIKDKQQILQARCRLGPAELGLLTLCGIVAVPVFKVPSVGCLSIGDELKELGNNLPPGCVYDSNRITLISLLKENDYDPVDFGISADQLNAIIDKIKNALEKVDVLVTMGRANDKDMLKNILKHSFNATIHFGCVDMKPGKSTTFATCEFQGKRKYLLCMSANPATVPVVAHVLLLPLLNGLRCCSAEPIGMHARVRLVFWYIYSPLKLHSRPEFLWTNLYWTNDEDTFAKVSHSESQQNVMKYPGANALLMLPRRTLEYSTLEPSYVPALLPDLK